jgi:ribosomal protein S14
MGCKSQIKNYCVISGRSRGVYRDFKISRILVRELASLGLFFGILSHLSRAYRWKFMLEPLGYKPRFINSTLAVLIGIL